MIRPLPDIRAVTIGGGAGVELSGTAVVPSGDNRASAALLLSGSGALDRDSNMPGQHLDVSSTLATALGSLGIASLRFDKRGVAASSGTFVSTGFDDETEDAAAALAALRNLDGVDPDRVGVIGHSVGATIAARLAAHNEGVAFAVLLGCAASTGADVMSWQTNAIAAALHGPSRLLGRQFRRIQNRNVQRLTTSETDVIRIGRKDEPARWMREYRSYDPLGDLAAVRCPVLAITGGKDLQVNPADVARIAAAVGGPCTTRVPENLTHVLRSSTSKPSVARYPRLLQQPVDSDLVQTVTTWTLSQTMHEPTEGDPNEHSA